MNANFYKSVLGARYGFKALAGLQPDSQAHLYLPNETCGSIRVGMARPRTSVEHQSQLCWHLRNHALLATRFLDQVVIIPEAILTKHMSSTYPFEYKCVDGVPETLAEMVGAVIYV